MTGETLRRFQAWKNLRNADVNPIEEPGNA